jgi:hypothetical protein
VVAAENIEEERRDEAPAAKEKARPQKPGSTRALVSLLAFVLGFATIPHRVCERDADKWWASDRNKTEALAKSVERWTASPETLVPQTFGTGSSRFDGEWLFATYMMSAMGFGQLALDRPDARERDADINRMEHCLDSLLAPRVRGFEDRAWGNDALATLTPQSGGGDDRGHVAYLGYAALALSLHRTLRPESRFAAREQAIIDALERRIEASRTGFVETYPGEVYPVDNTAALAALAMHSHFVSHRESKALARGLEAIRTKAIEPATGLLIQAVTVEDAKPRDSARASGTALAAYFLSFADATTSRGLFRALEHRQYRTVLGFGGVMEFPTGTKRRAADVDSGPVVLGFGVSASGFAIGASRAHGDREMFTALFATAHLFGAPLDEDGTRTYATGGPIGDAILFAMLTAKPASRYA